MKALALLLLCLLPVALGAKEGALGVYETDSNCVGVADSGRIEDLDACTVWTFLGLSWRAILADGGDDDVDISFYDINDTGCAAAPSDQFTLGVGQCYPCTGCISGMAANVTWYFRAQLVPDDGAASSLFSPLSSYLSLLF